MLAMMTTTMTMTTMTLIFDVMRKSDDDDDDDDDDADDDDDDDDDGPMRLGIPPKRRCKYFLPGGKGGLRRHGWIRLDGGVQAKRLELDLGNS